MVTIEHMSAPCQGALLDHDIVRDLHVKPSYLLTGDLLLSKAIQQFGPLTSAFEGGVHGTATDETSKAITCGPYC